MKSWVSIGQGVSPIQPCKPETQLYRRHVAFPSRALATRGCAGTGRWYFSRKQSDNYGQRRRATMSFQAIPSNVALGDPAEELASCIWACFSFRRENSEAQTHCWNFKGCRESQNHRMFGAGRDLCGSPSPTPCRSRVTYSRLRRTLSRRVLNISREADSTTSLGSLFQCSVTLRGKKFFLMFRWNFLCFSYGIVIPGKNW